MGKKSKQNFRQNIKIFVMSILCFAFLFYPHAGLKADIPEVINYQSRLRSAGGVPVTSSTQIQFSVYSAQTGGAPGDVPSETGPLLWKEVYDQASGPCAKVQPDLQGYFFVKLGSCVAFPNYLKFEDELYLAVKIESDAEAQPRVLLAAFPYALNSKRVGAFVASTSTPGILGEAQGNATAINQGVDSASILLQGSGWNGASSEFKTLSIRNVMTDANNYRFSVFNDNDTELFSISNAGSVSTTDLFLSNNLTIQGIALSATGTSNLTSGAALVGVFDEFVNSNGVTVQEVLADLDAAIASVSSTAYSLDFQQVTNNGSTTTFAIQFAGGTSTADFNVQGTLLADYALFTAATSSDLYATTFGFNTAVGAEFLASDATTTNLFATNLNALSGAYTDLTSVNLDATYATFTNLAVLNPVYFQNLTFDYATGSALALSSYLTINGIRLDDVGTNNLSSGAYLIGVFDEFANSNATSVQAVLNDLDALLESALNQINNLQSDLAAATSTIANIQTDLASATSSIAQNATDIANVSSTVATNTANIAQNTADIAQNQTDISNLQTDLANATSSIAQNATDIANVSSTVATNTANIAQNASDIAAVSSTVSQNTADIATVSSTLAQTQTDLQTVSTTVANIDLQYVTDRGSITTRAMQFAGGTSTAALIIQNTLSVIGISNFADIIFQNATGTNLALTNSLSIGGILLSAVGASNITSGASIIGVFDEFVNSNNTTVQAVLKDLDTAITAVSVSSSAMTLQQITDNGATTTNAIQFAGGTSTADFNVQGTLDADYALFTAATSSDFYATLFGFNNAVGAEFLATNATTTKLFATNLEATNATIAGLDFDYATGTGLALASYLTINGIQLDAVGTNNTNSGATLIGVFDEFANSNATTVQAVLADFDAWITQNANDIAYALNEIAAATSTIATIESNLANVTSTIATIQTDLGNATSSIANLQTDLANATSSIAQNATDIANVSSTVATNTANIAQNTADIAQNQTDISNLQTDLAGATSSIASLQTDLANATSSIAQNATDIANVSSTVATNTANIAQNAADIAAVSSTVSQNTADIATVSSTLAQTQTDLQTVSTTVANIDLQYVTDRGSITTRAMQFAGGTSTAALIIQNTLSAIGISNFADIVFQNATGTNLALTNSLSIGGILLSAVGVSNITSGASIVGVFDEFVNSNGATVQAVLKDLDTVLANLTNTVFNIQTDLAATTSTVATLQTDLASATSSIAQNAADIANVSSTVATNTANIAQNAADIAQNQTDISNLQTDLAGATSSIANLQTDLANATSSIAQNAADISAVSSTVGTNTANIAQNAADIATVSSTVDAIDLQYVTDRGSITTHGLQFAGGTSTAGLIIQNTLNVAGLSYLNGLIFASATGTSMSLTNFLSIGGIRLDAIGTSPWTSGAALVGVFDEFGYSNATTVQGVLKDLDTAIANVPTSTGGGSQNLQDVTNLGNVTTNTIQFAGGTSTGDFNVQGELVSQSVSSTYIYGSTVSTTELWIDGKKIEVAPNIFQGRQSAAFNDSTNGNWESILLNSTRKDSYYTHTNGNSVVTITATGTYRLSGQITFYQITDLGSERSVNQVRIYKNNSTAVTDEIFTYSRQPSSGEGTATIPTTIVNLNTGDYLELQGAKYSGQSEIGSLSASMLIEAVTINGESAGGGNQDLQSVTDQGSITTNAIQFAGGTSTADFIVNSQFTALGGSGLQQVSFTYATGTQIALTGGVNSNLLPSVTDQYYLGDAANRWLGLYVQTVTSTNIFTTNLQAANVTSTNIYASGYVSTTALYVNGVQITGGGSQSFQDVTDIGNVTTNGIQFAGGTSTGDLMPGAHLAYDLGRPGMRWDEIYVRRVRLGTNSWDLEEALNGNLTIGYTGATSTAKVSIGTDTTIAGTVDANGASFITATTTDLAVLGFVNSALLPSAPDIYELGSFANRWLGMYVTNVTTTNLSVSGVVSTTAIYVNGQQIATSTPTFQQVTEEGNVTSLAIQFAGGTSTSDFNVQGTLDADYSLFTAATSTDLYATTFGFNSAAGAEFIASNATTTNLFATNLEATNFAIDNLDFDYATGTALALSSYLTINGIKLDAVGTNNTNSGATLIGVFDEFANSNAGTVQGVLADFDDWISQNANDITYAISELAAATSTLASISAEIAIVSSTLATTISNLVNVTGDIANLQTDLANATSSIAQNTADIASVSSSLAGTQTDLQTVSTTVANIDLQYVTDRGAITTHGLQFAGGTSTAGLIIQNTLNVAGLSYLNDLIFASASGTSLALTDFLSIGGIRLDAIGTSPWTSGAALVGVFDEFDNSNATTVQGVLADLDAAISAVTSSGGGFDGRMDDTLIMGTAPSRTETTWTNTGLSGGGYESVRSLVSYKGHLYAGRGDGGGEGDIYVCDPTAGGNTAVCDNSADWSQAYNTGYDQVNTLYAYKGYLYAGFGDDAGEGDIYYCNPGLTGDADICESGDWNDASFPSGPYRIRQIIEFNNYLYAANDTGSSGSGSVGVCNPAAAGNANICDNSSDWTNISFSGYEELPALAVFNNRLYGLMGNSNGSDNDLMLCDSTAAGDAGRCDSSSDWSVSLADPYSNYDSFESAAVYRGLLYFGAGNDSGDGDLYSCDPGVLGLPTLCDSTYDIAVSQNNGSGVYRIPALLSYDGFLFMGYEGTTAGGGQIYKYDVSNAYLSDAGTGFEATYAFADFNGYLYAGRGNSSGDGEVWYYQTARTGSYDIAFEAGNATGSVWFDNEAYSMSGAGDSQSIGAFKFSHGIITDAGAYDLAEMYPSADPTLEAGDVVALDDVWEGYVKKSSMPYESSLVGVVSTKPGFLLSGPKDENARPIALVGRVPVKVSLENGEIKVGDNLTSASIPGYAMKSSESGMILGQAMESFTSSTANGATTGTVMMFVRTSFGVQKSGFAINSVGAASSIWLLQQTLSADLAGLTLQGSTSSLQMLTNGALAAEKPISLATGDILSQSFDLNPASEQSYFFSLETALGKATVLTTENSDLYLMPQGDQIILRPLFDSAQGVLFMDADGGTPIMTVDTLNHRIGINMDNPTVELDVNGDAKIKNIEVQENIWMNKDKVVKFNGKDGQSQIGYNSFDNSLKLQTELGSNVNVVLGDNDGNTEFVFTSSDGTKAASVDSKGNTYLAGSLAVGTEKPKSKLHVDSNQESENAIATFENAGGDFEVYRVDKSPEGLVAGNIGDLAVDTVNGTTYIKQSGDGLSNGWVQFATGTPLYYEMDTLDSIAERGNETNWALSFRGGTSTGDLLPQVTNAFSLGAKENQWSNVWTEKLNIGAAAWSLSENELGDLTIGNKDLSALTIKTDGKVGIGTDAPEAKLQVSDELKEAQENAVGLYSQMSARITSAGGYAKGMKSVASMNSDQQAALLQGLVGLEAMAVNEGSGLVHDAMGATLGVMNGGDGSITYAHGLMVRSAINSGTGKISRLSGITVEEQTAAVYNTNLLIGTSTAPTADYSIYNESGKLNFFAGNLGIGVVVPELPLDVRRVGGAVAAFSRVSNDGKIISLKQDDYEEGTISIYGSVVSYNAFTGSHYAWTDDEISSGMLVVMTGENKRLHDRADSQYVYGVKLCTKANDAEVMGAYVSVLEPKLTPSKDNPHIVMAAGKGEIWVADNGKNIRVGDYLVSSDVAGHAMKDLQDEPVSYVVARAAENVDWSKVEAEINGVKHVKMAVFFDSFSKNNLDQQIQSSVLGITLQGGELKEGDIPDLHVAGAIFEGTVTVKKHMVFGRDTVGQALIMSGESEVHVSFKGEYETLPIVTITPVGLHEFQYGVKNITLQGFDIILSDKTYEDTLFNWHAFGNDDSKVFVSNGTTLEIEVTEMGSSKIEYDMDVLGEVLVDEATTTQDGTEHEARPPSHEAMEDSSTESDELEIIAVPEEPDEPEVVIVDTVAESEVTGTETVDEVAADGTEPEAEANADTTTTTDQ
ncbi:MAG: hypothetical protein ACOYUZ_04035 [Patescibacteria group bacterium]